ncbi:N-acetyltransferase [Legionella sp. km772]|nr:N-acetyltransferase [Legionella sp. km772]
MSGNCSGSGKLHHLLIKKLKPIVAAIGDLNGTQLTGESLLCQTLRMEYAEDICKNFTAKITKWMWPSAPKTQTQINQHILEQQQAMSKGEELALLVLKKESLEFLGYIALHELNTTTPEMGIWLKEEAHGQGYGFEALSLLKKWADKNLSFDYLKYPVEKNNLASRALAEKLGGKVEGEYIKKSESGQVLDEVEYRFYKLGDFMDSIV